MKIEALFATIAIVSGSTAFAAGDCTAEVIDVKILQAREAIQTIGSQDPDRAYVLVSQFQRNLSAATASADLTPVCATYDAVIAAAVEG